MKYIEVDEELYRFIAAKTERIGESASDILRRLLGLSVTEVVNTEPKPISQPGMEATLAPQTDINADYDFEHLLSESLLEQQKGAVGRFLFVLESLHRANPAGFSKVLQIQGRDRLYFATSRDALLQASQSANPKEIGSSGFWVTTNNNTGKKRMILQEVLECFGCDPVRAASIGERALG
ncbi:replication initiation negative regulator SeqA [Shewanella cyperi]|uniref:Negative modulator of initiation of replication n=1 Tax=Shewanella cyperi TaxID=2814292 RepID=A0A974XHI6_9GAMM|nr:replication initiation negative regulator SeqA [Shewanella cyperi]QSX28474.1 replication initiation negative regulator SeqA [Shewanella cyperi]QSX39233.1 replication initiation negative regulator SeqA [Shewanella cyperi]